MTPDGKRVVIAGSTCSMVDAETLGNPRTMTRFIDSGSPSATDDGSVLEFNCLVPSGTGEKWAAMLVDGATGAYLKTIIAGGTPSISSDGSRLVFKGATYQTYDVATGQLLSNIDQLNSWGVAPSADLKTLVGFAFARNEIHVFRTSDGVRTQVIIDDRFLGSTAGCLSDDGSKLYLVQQGRIAVFKTSDWSMVQEIPVEFTFAAQASICNNDKTLLAVNNDWESGRSQLLAIDLGSGSVRVLKDESNLQTYTASRHSPFILENDMKLVDVETGSVFLQYRDPLWSGFQGSFRQISGSYLSPDGRTAYFCREDAAVFAVHLIP